MSGENTVLISILEAAGLDSPRRQTALEEEVSALFLQLRSPLLRYLFSIGLPAQEAEEIAQEVFLALFRHLRQGKPRTNLKAWVFRAAHNLGLKARGRMQRAIALDEQQDNHPDPSPSPEEQFAHSQRRQRLRAVVNALPPSDRACVHLRAAGLKYRDIASVLGISLGAVAQSLERTLGKLRRLEVSECR
ncbi:MAG: RNA polymerase sigma factor [Bryobacterales bacterium]|nr:RNA polymerase sigma factor [Bryobacterales bacterium]